MATHPSNSSDVAADLYNRITGDGEVEMLLGTSVLFDTPAIWFRYDANSALSDSFPDVIKPTLQTGNGRWIKFDPKQIQSDWNAITGQGVISNKPTLLQQAYEGTNQRVSAFPVFLSSTVSSGSAIFQLTTNGMAAGTAIFPNGVIQDSLNLYVNDATASFQMSVVFTNASKTATVTANKLTTANILTGILGQSAANGSVIRLQIWGY